jgi:hypothetical protein
MYQAHLEVHLDHGGKVRPYSTTGKGHHFVAFCKTT